MSKVSYDTTRKNKVILSTDEGDLTALITEEEAIAVAKWVERNRDLLIAQRDRESDMKKLSIAFFKNLIHCHPGGSGPCGSISLHMVNPLGPGHTEHNILDLLGFNKPFTHHEDDYAKSLFEGLIPWLQEKYGKESDAL